MHVINFTVGPPLDVVSPMIEHLFTSNNFASVRVTWMPVDGNYDSSHFTIKVFETNTDSEIESIAISAETNRFKAILTVPFISTMSFYASITVTSKCNQTTSGVPTPTIRINKS